MAVTKRRRSAPTEAQTEEDLSTLTVEEVLPGEMPSLEDAPLLMIVMGMSGAGKTRLAFSFCLDPRTAPALFLDPTGSTRGIRRNPELFAQMQTSGSTIRRVQDGDTILKQLRWLSTHNRKLHTPFKTVVLDDATESFELTKQAEAKRRGTTVKDMPGLAYVAIYETWLEIFRLLYKLGEEQGMNVVMNCWPEKEAHPETQQMLWVPKFSGKFGYMVPGYFDVVGYLAPTIEEQKKGNTINKRFTNRLITMSDDYFVKDRYALFGARDVQMPSASKIMDILKGGDFAGQHVEPKPTNARKKKTRKPQEENNTDA